MFKATVFLVYSIGIIFKTNTVLDDIEVVISNEKKRSILIM